MTAATWLVDEVLRAGHKVLWVTHRRELMEQTARAFIAAAPRLSHGKPTRDELAIRLIGGGYSPVTTVASDNHDLAIASVETLRNQRKALAQWLKAHDVFVVFDEAHHSPAKGWRDILELAYGVTGDAVLGLTATPTRMVEGQAKLLERLYGGGEQRGDAFTHESTMTG
jgi:superfamily II DNA or RNA helicase